MNITRNGIVLAAFLGVTAAHAVASKPITLAYKLPKKASLVRPTLPPALLSGPVRLDVVDARGDVDPEVVGSQIDKDTVIYQWSAKQEVAPAVRGFIGTILKGWSVPVGTDGENALAVKLTRYWVDEKAVTFGSSYHVQVHLTVSIVDRAGTVSATHDGEGSASVAAVDGRESTCNELLSVALYDALTQALGQSAAAPAAAPARAAPIVVEPAALYDDLVRMKSGGVADDVLAAYVKQRRLARPLTVDEILAWKNAGIPDAVIKLAVE
jgi:hypothetical protein